ncbi:MAG: ATP-binding protein [Nodosilinea sp.]
MRRPSLQRRLALLSATLAGGVLVGFALLSAWLIHQAKLERLDAQLERALGLVLRPRGEALALRLEERLPQELGLDRNTAVGVLVLDGDGQVRYQSEGWPEALTAQNLWSQVRQLPETQPSGRQPSLRRRPLPTATLGPVTQRTGTGRWRVVGRATPLGQVAIAVSLQAIYQEMAAIRRIYLITIPGALGAMAAGAWALSGRALKPLDRLGQTISQVTAEGLHQRVPTTGLDAEFEPLITVFNAMLERLERSFHQASRFSGDAAHELKTPLAILQGELEQAIQRVETGSATQQTLSQLLDEVRRLSGIVRKLLLLSLADAGQMNIRREPVNISTMVQEALDDIPLLAPELAVTAEVEPGLVVRGDRDLLVQVWHNLVSNAIKYNQPQGQSPGWIRVQAQQTSGQVQITIANAAQPLSPEQQTHLFERFYRADATRTRKIEGLGLGLSLSREIARAHGGDVWLGEAAAGDFRICLGLPAPEKRP